MNRMIFVLAFTYSICHMTPIIQEMTVKEAYKSTKDPKKRRLLRLLAKCNGWDSLVTQ